MALWNVEWESVSFGLNKLLHDKNYFMKCTNILVTNEVSIYKALHKAVNDAGY